MKKLFALILAIALMMSLSVTALATAYDTPGNKGMYLMTDEWFNEYMYQIVVHKKYLSDEVIAAYESDPIVLAPWDPMGSLA